MPTVSHKVRPEEDLAPADRREGTWTKLELLEMDARFCSAMRRAHPELVEEGRELGPLERRQRA